MYTHISSQQECEKELQQAEEHVCVCVCECKTVWLDREISICENPPSCPFCLAVQEDPAVPCCLGDQEVLAYQKHQEVLHPAHMK